MASIHNAHPFRPDAGTPQPLFPWPLTVLIHRFVLFLAFQAAIAALFALQGASRPWQASIAWWPLTATLTNLVSIGLLHFLTRREGISWRQLIHANFGREHLRRDLLTVLALLLVISPIAMGPNFGLAQLLFGDINTALGLYLLPLPRAVALISLVLFPLTIPFAELPSYFGYVMPRLAARWEKAGQGQTRQGQTRQGQASWWAVLVPAFWLSAQHMMLPFIPDLRFVLYRLGMFLPFALLLGFVIRWRPRLLPYLMAIHALMDLGTMLMVWMAAVGG